MACVRRRSLIAALSLALACATAALSVLHGAQERTDSPPPGDMRLLPGYRHTQGRGIDSMVGRIWKEGGPIISYDIGPGSSPFTTPRSGDNTLWVKTTTVGQKTKFAVNMQKDGDTFLVDIGCGSSFAAQNVRTKEELAEVLLMLMSHRPFVDC